ncbi:hypothetical protein C8J56DRAFT_178536 [Mycena floridula]|nr:hypothetical protein C8J56DRAFT_178536 [Mycena floridula]
MLGKIILEEAYNIPRLAQQAVGYASPAAAIKLVRDMTDIQGRLVEMDAHGVEMQVLSLTAPGCQGQVDPIAAKELAIEANNWIYNEIKAIRHRFTAFAAVSMHNASDASDELRRCVNELGFVGVMLNDYQSVVHGTPNAEDGFQGEQAQRLYFDDPVFDPFWATCQELDVPVYIHPRLHENAFYEKRPHLAASAHGFKTQLSSHIVAIITSGVFDRFPRLQLIFGHMGEGITNDLWRLDHKLDRNRFPKMRMRKDRTIRDYFSMNLHITSSGHFSTTALSQAISEIGASRILFSVDFPYEDSLKEGCQWFDKVPIANPDKLAIGRTNALKLLKLEKLMEKDLFELKIGGLEGHVYGHA